MAEAQVRSCALLPWVQVPLRSRWTIEMPQFSPIPQDITTDVCVVGAGIAGVTTAYLLAREVVVDGDL